MKILPLLVLTIALYSQVSCAVNKTNHTTDNANELDWLVGCWVNAQGNSMEVWARVDDNSLSGFSATASESRIGFYEVLQLRKNGHGKWVYTASPGGAPAVAFTELSQTDGEAILFANPAHDFPQEISYQRAGDKLFASISATGGEQPRHFHKQSCN